MNKIPSNQRPSVERYGRRQSLWAAILSLLMVLNGCDPVVDPGPVVTGLKGIYVLNEGAFSASNAELSFIAEDRSSASGSVFSTVNPGKTLGDVAQHARLADGMLYIVVNNSRKIEVIEAGTHRWLRTISLSRAPRAIEVVLPNKAYVTNMDSTVSVIDLHSGLVTRDIVVGAYPEGMLRSGDRLFVFNSSWGYGTTISVIDLAADSVRQTIASPPGPTYGVIGPSGVLHVLCTGTAAWGGSGSDIPGSILTIDAASATVIDTLVLSQPAGRFAVDASGALYVTMGGQGPAGIWKLLGGMSPAVVSTNLVVGTFYGIGVDDTRSELYLASAGDYVSNGSVHVYTFSGAPVRSYHSGIGVAPNGFVVLP